MRKGLVSAWAAVSLVAAAGASQERRDDRSAGGKLAQSVAPPASQTDDGPLPATSLLVHKDGSVTVTVGGKQHKLSPKQSRQQVPKLLAGQEHIVIRMEDWKQFGQSGGADFPNLYIIGVRRVTLDVEFAGKRERRTHDLPPPTLAEQIEGTDPAVRKAARKKLDEMFHSGRIGGGLNVLFGTRNAQFKADRNRLG